MVQTQQLALLLLASGVRAGFLRHDNPLDLASAAMNINPTACKEKTRRKMHLIRIFTQSAKARMNKYN